MSKSTMTYRGYIAKVEFSVEDKCFHGKIDGIADLVTFEADRASEIEKEFHAAVDDYIALCAEIGKEPDKRTKGPWDEDKLDMLEMAMQRDLERFHIIPEQTGADDLLIDICTTMFEYMKELRKRIET